MGKLYEDEPQSKEIDPDAVTIADRKLFAQPYDLSISSLIGQIKDGTLHLRPLSARPRFQRRYVWPNRLASHLVESILLNIPIPPCYFSQNRDFELDVIDGQQRIYSIYRFIDNQFALSGLEVTSEMNGLRYHQLERRVRRQIETHTLRAVVITNESHPDIQFDVFERLNTLTMPLNAQELRNCMYRGPLNDLLGELAEYQPWQTILGRTQPDNRLRDEELILRFFAFYEKGIESYRTPQKHWLNKIADEGRTYSDEKISELRDVWKKTIDNCLIVFRPNECFRRLTENSRLTINRALMDLVMSTLANRKPNIVRDSAVTFRRYYAEMLSDDSFQDLISRSVDHKSRTIKRFDLWNALIVAAIF